MKSTALVLGATLMLLTGDALRAAETNSPSCCAPPAPAPSAPLPDQSLFLSETKWTTDAGTSIRLGDLRGRPQVIVMFFTHCQSACPVLVQDLKRIEAALPPALRPQVRFTLVSFDAQRDTPAVLKAFRETHRLPADRWTLLHGGTEEVRELAALLGVQFKAAPDGQFSHSNLITVLNADGERVHQLAGLNQDIRETAGVLQRYASRPAFDATNHPATGELEH